MPKEKKEYFILTAFSWFDWIKIGWCIAVGFKAYELLCNIITFLLTGNYPQ